MNKALVIALLAACGGSKGSAIRNGETSSTGGSAMPAGCPLSAADGVEDRFPVGGIPIARVEGMSEGPKCYDVFVPSDVIVAQGTSFKIVKEGVFEGHCPGEPDNRRKYQAYAPASALIEVNALASSDGELGFGKPITLEAGSPDKVAGVIVHAADRCGSKLTLGGAVPATWTAGDGCTKVAKLVPHDTSSPDPTSPEQQVAPIGAGTCTFSVELLGAKGTIQVTVK